MRDVNKIMLLGRLGADPVRKETKNGRQLVLFPIATSRRLADLAEKPAEPEPDSGPDPDNEDGPEEGEGNKKDRHREETQWHRVVVWGKQGENCARYLRKGQSAFVEGSVRTRKYTDAANEQRYLFEVHAESVVFLSSKRAGRTESAGEPGNQTPVSAEVITAAEPEMELVS